MIEFLQGLFVKGAQVDIDGINPDVTLEQTLSDTTTITKHPVEVGAQVSDHAFMNPSAVTMRIGFTDAKGFFASLLGSGRVTAQEAYEQLLDLQRERAPFDLVTTRRSYTEMLIQGISTTIDNQTSNILLISVQFEQIIRVSTSTVALTPSTQAFPAQTAPVQNTGTKQPQAVPSSALDILSGIFR